ncbi:WbuC family cupin fold metalloprotein [Candidatus Gottesmanbacteria bacterium]|nr:WbuC family cupin fold metalloprotein [Candidatus Gottesmanbacteria bacterium]
MLKRIDNKLIQKTINEAKKSPRRRAHSRFHDYKDPVQRMVNVYMKDAYIQPHKHHNPDKVEVFLSLKGKFLSLAFDDHGQVIEHIIFGEKEKIKGVEIPPKIWHAFWALEDEGVIYEIIQGPYDPQTHKKFAPWAPSEGEPDKAKKYMSQLKNKYAK